MCGRSGCYVVGDEIIGKICSRSKSLSPLSSHHLTDNKCTIGGHEYTCNQTHHLNFNESFVLFPHLKKVVIKIPLTWF